MEQHKLGRIYYLRAERYALFVTFCSAPPGALKISQIMKMKKGRRVLSFTVDTHLLKGIF
jgi:hypothetical protein